MSSYPFVAEYDKRGLAKCKKCKQKLEKGILRIGKIAANPFGEGEMKVWHHVDCIFDTFLRARATTKKLEDPIEDLDGWNTLEESDKEIITKKISQYFMSSKATPKKVTAKRSEASSTSGNLPQSQTEDETATAKKFPDSKDNSFREFRRICAKIAEVDSYLSKTEVVAQFLKVGSDGEKFKGDYKLWIRLLLPGVIKRVYNLQSKQLLKLFSQLCNQSIEEMVEDLEKGDIAETIRIFFEKSSLLSCKKSTFTLPEVDALLDELSKQTQEEPQCYVLKKIAKKCTGNDLKMVVRLIKGDLRINAGAKHILNAVHPDAYEAFKSTRDLDSVLDQVLGGKPDSAGSSKETLLNIAALVMTPVQPMLAEACRSVEYAFKKCPNGMYAEIKYDGERVQVHKSDKEFKYFSRSLKPVVPYKVSHFKDYIPLAFPYGKDLILDSEVLLIDTTTGNPMPFGSLGVHKKNQFKDANVCLFVFDCIYYNGKNLMDRPISERRTVLKENIVEVKNHIVLSEMKEVHKQNDLSRMISKVLSQGLEGLVVKDLKSTYEPGKRHWLKIKKDYLNEGAMADSADLVVLGAWFGTGKKGGMMSVFLMGCLNPGSNKWCTVTKVHTGFDDAALKRLQTELKMTKIGRNADMAPQWLHCSKDLVPDFVAVDPKESPVWEVTGAEFTRHDKHTADGISVRFPRVTKERPDKTWKEATNLNLLKILYEKSKEHAEITGLGSDDERKEASTSNISNPDNDAIEIKKKRKEKKAASVNNSKRPSDSLEERNGKKVKLDNLKAAKRLSLSEKVIKDNALPDVFAGVLLHIPDSIADSELLQRYFISYGGQIVKNTSSEKTHSILSQGETVPSSGQEIIITESWLWDSIKLKKIQPERYYLPKKLDYRKKTSISEYE